MSSESKRIHFRLMCSSCIRLRSTRLLRQATCTTSTRRCLESNFIQEGYCKYGERCTFAHGDQDLKAKFVPAETLYPTGPQQMYPEKVTSTAPMYGTVDYSAFAPPPSMQSASYSVPEPVEPSEKQAEFSLDFGMGPFDVNKLTEDFDEKLFVGSFSYQSNGKAKENGFKPKAAPSYATSVPKYEFGLSSEKSRFGFEYEPLHESIHELELTNPSDKSLKEKFDQAKFEIDIGNELEGNKILKEMMDNQEIRYKIFNPVDNGVFMNAFTPFSE
uniref:C3H1-type domain-containing protein n=1 Tax=Euplotes harpa TaxID=151035 RepID=A0A7S3N8B0_9SPIT|mmetsp:Transcript_33154/g.38082  ORF Transcript_33154/g.38082 Transcript_33154/m.38082 type:complete len:273 (+) Transcript_33154:199-1017(+)